LLRFALGAIKHVPILSYPKTETLNVIWKAVDSLRLLGKLQRSCCKVPPERHVFGSLYLFKKPTNVGS
jgi:hypothetical protein